MRAELAPDADVLVIVVARIGDTLLVTPALRALRARARDGRLTVLAHPKRREVLENLPFIDRLGGLSPGRARLRGWVGGRAHDWAFVYGRDAALVRYARRVSRRTVAFEDATEDEGVLRVARPDALHAVDERLLLVEAAGVAAAGRRLAYAVREEERAWARAWLAGRVSGGARPLIGLQMASFPTKAHRDWPVESFAALAAQLAQHRPAAGFLVLGDARARQAAGRVQAAVPARVGIAAGEATLRQSAALIEALDLYVGVDTGPTHIAGALEVPMVGIYHADYPGRNLAPRERRRFRLLEQSGSEPLAVATVLGAAVALLEEAGR